MAKRVYGIPYDFNSSYLDMEIAIQTQDGLGLKPFPIKKILVGLAAILGGYLALTKTVLQYGTVFQKGLFIVVWVALCALLLLETKTQQLGIQKIIPLVTFMNTSSRRVATRSNSPATNMISICNLVDVTDDGLLIYSDNSCGRVFDVIGSGSALLFDRDKEDILNQVDAHYRKLRPDTTYNFITVKESQQIKLQVEAYNRRKDMLTVQDADLIALINTNTHVLNNIVGSNFKSLHQYLILQAKNQEELNLSLEILRSEVENSNRMFKFVEQLEKPRVLALLTSIYGERKEIQRYGITKKQKSRNAKQKKQNRDAKRKNVKK